MTRTPFQSALEAAYAARKLTRLHVHIGYLLHGWRSRCPTHRKLAQAAKCSIRTVQRALSRLHELGLLSWTRRVLACVGFRAQIANAYHLLSHEPLSYLTLRTQSSVSLSPSVSAEFRQRQEARIMAAWQARRATQSVPISIF